MVVTSEIDALRTMAVDPNEFVLAPKFVATIITVPCLRVMSNAFGMFAGWGFMYISGKTALRCVCGIAPNRSNCATSSRAC